MSRTKPASTLAHRLFSIALVVGLFGCDHATKMAAKASLAPNAAIPIAPSVLGRAVELRYVENPDIAFSALHKLGIRPSPALLVLVSIGALALAVVMAVALRRGLSRGEVDPGRERVARIGFALVVAGGIGNVVDRLVRGVVIDFIHVKGWPVFNVADIVIVVGMGLVALSSLVPVRSRTT